MAYVNQPAPKKSNKTWLIVLAAALGVCLVCGWTAAGTGLLVMLFGSPPSPAVKSPQLTATRRVSVLAPTRPPAMKTIRPTSPQQATAPTPSAEKTIQPEQPSKEPATATTAPQTSGTFMDDFSTPDSAWPVETTDMYIKGYSQMQNYFINVLQADHMVYVIPPHHLQPPFANVIISANVKPGANSGFGFLCGFQDIKNFYAVKVSGSKYTVYKNVQGQFINLTSPQWLPANGIENTDQFGQVHLLVNCMGSSIGVEINGIGQKMVVDDANSFPTGNVAIFAAAEAANGDNAGTTVNFDDFSLQVTNP